MSDPDVRLTEKASELRRAFDRSFAEAPRTKQAPLQDLLAIRVGTDPYAIRLSEVAGLFVGKTVTRLPNAVPEFLGIAGFRGAVVPVYDLRALLGYSPGNAPRWLVIVSTTPVALAFDAFDGHLRRPSSAVAREERMEHTRKHVREVLQTDDSLSQSGAGLARPIVDVNSVLETIKQRAQKGASQ